MKLLLVDDDPDHLAVLVLGLRRRGYDVLTAVDGDEALARWQSDRPDLVVLDLNLPKVNGFEVCRRIRQEAMTPIILLTGRREDEDIVRGLQLGADDYVTKPFSLKLLVARIEVVWRRSQRARADAASRTIQVGDLTIDRERSLVTMAGRVVALTRLEVRLLEVLAQNAGQVVPYARLIQHGWGYDEGSTRLLKPHISNLRRKLGLAAGTPGGIRSVAGVGYRLSRSETGPPAGGAPRVKV
jgi:DNA-binding response OmpR family regulator